jgi:hypothetical protein
VISGVIEEAIETRKFRAKFHSKAAQGQRPLNLIIVVQRPDSSQCLLSLVSRISARKALPNFCAGALMGFHASRIAKRVKENPRVASKPL